MAPNNTVILQGNVTGDIYYDVINNGKGVNIPFLRVYLMVNGSQQSRPVHGLRVVFYGVRALEAEAHIQRGTKIFVEGHLQTRRIPNGDGSFRHAVEVVADTCTFVDHVDWERGRAKVAELKEAGKYKNQYESLFTDNYDNIQEFVVTGG